MLTGALVEEYKEPTVSSKTWIHSHSEHPLTRIKEYLLSLFPILQWIYRYNLTWLYGDLIAGLTVGIVVVPQGMSYAKVASLAPEYGLYSSFVGVFIYCFFATSKDVSIGPVAVMSMQVGRTIVKVTEKYPQYADQGPLIGITLSLLCGGIAAGLGLLRLGFILEFIPIPAVMGFMTGSAFSILAGQLPGLFGIANRLNTRAATYQVIINFLKQLKHSNIDAAFGLVSLFILYLLKYISDYGQKRYPKLRIGFFYVGVLRSALVIIFATIISWACYRHDKGSPSATLIKTVPSGLRHVGVPTIDKELISAIASEIPVSVIVLLLEHIAISKSFGRINDYKIVPDQELIAIGVTNLIGVFFSAYPATGSFSRSALKAKCGVRTPLAGIFTGGVVLLALYCLTEAFYWIPNATLCAIIIHAVYDLMANPKSTFKLWQVSPLEAIIFLAAVFITVFVSIEAGIYFSICASLAFMLLRIAKAKGDFLGRIEYFEVLKPTIVTPGSTNTTQDLDGDLTTGSDSSASSTADKKSHSTKEITTELPALDNEISSIQLKDIPSPQIQRKFKWVPMDLKNLNPKLNVLPPPPGVIVFRPNESFTYPNCSRQVDRLFDEVKRVTRKGVPSSSIKLGDRPWNDHGPRNRKTLETDERPLLRAIVLDFSSVPYLDSTGIQNLADIRNAINKYADQEVEFHFVGLISPWTRRALVTEGFGSGNPSKVVVGVATSYLSLSYEQVIPPPPSPQPLDEESSIGSKQQLLTPLLSTDTPFFHAEIPDFD